MDQHSLINLGPARLEIVPPGPLVWRPLAEDEPGPAGLCLALLQAASPRWEDGGALSPAQMAALPARSLDRLLPKLCTPWLSPGQQKSLARWEAYLRTALDFPNLNCRDCQDQAERDQATPGCADCPLADPPAGTAELMQLMRLMEFLPSAAHGLIQAFLPKGMDGGRARLLAHQLALIAELSRQKQAPSKPD